MSETSSQLKQLFAEAVGLPADRRAAFLDERCRGNAALRDRLEALLAAQNDIGEYLASPTLGERTIGVSAEGWPKPGGVVGPYRLLELIGEGGFGMVYMAEQQSPIHRRVALKVIKPGMDTRRVIARFEQERQALAMMDHPNIARVLDAGATPEGRPYFVMELVKGEPITTYCDTANLTTPERLDLFMPICHAVQHAHQKGVIHRDIKPSNVLVTLHDGRPVPKVIDFGIAKATQGRLTEMTLFTAHREMIGTPEYMSPEQAEMSGLDIDTRTDIYSLGVLLYELLTGTTPFDAQELRAAAYDEILRVIREVDPPKPSTRISTLGDQLAGIAAHRRTEPRKLGALVRGDLDWIVMKALEKERTRRYEAASELAIDVQRHLLGAAVEAAPPSAAYRVKKFVRRNKGPVVAVCVVAGALLAGIVGTLWQARVAMHRAEHLNQVVEFQGALIAGIEADRMGIRLRQSIVDRRRAVIQSAPSDAEVVEESIRELERSLAGVNFTSIALEALDAGTFEPALAAITSRFCEQPLVKASLLQSLANATREIGLLDRSASAQMSALAIRRELLGPEHHDTLESVSNAGVLLWSQGRLAEAEEYHRNAATGRRHVLGNDHPDTMKSHHDIGVLQAARGRLTEAEATYREVLAARRRILGETHPDTLTSISALGRVLYTQAQYTEAEPYYRLAADGFRRTLGAEHPRTLTAIGNLASFELEIHHRFDEAERGYTEVLEIRRRVLGDDHPHTLNSIYNLGYLLQERGRYDQAERCHREVLERRRAVFGPLHPDTLTSCHMMAVVLQRLDRLGEAGHHYQEALEGRRLVLGRDHADTLATVGNIARLYQARGELAEAERWHREALTGYRRVSGDDHRDTLSVMGNLGALLMEQGRFDEAEPLLQDTMAGFRRAFGPEHPNTLVAAGNVGALLEARGLWAEVVSLLEPLGPRFRAAFQGADSRRLGVLLARLGAARLRMGFDEERFRRAREELLEGYAILSHTRGDSHPETVRCTRALADLFAAWHTAQPEQGHEVSAAEWAARIPTKP